MPPDRVKIYSVNGDGALFGDPLFKNPADQDFRLRTDSSATEGRLIAGAYPQNALSEAWWKRDFPPKLVHIQP